MYSLFMEVQNTSIHKTEHSTTCKYGGSNLAIYIMINLNVPTIHILIENIPQYGA